MGDKSSSQKYIEVVERDILGFNMFLCITCREGYIQEENATLVRTVLRSHNGSLPFKYVITDWASTAIWWGISTETL